jgi:hypothetical protein
MQKSIKKILSIRYNIIATWRDKAGNIIRQEKKHNLVATVGRAVIAQRLANDTTYTGTIKYCALGSNTTAPTSGDIQLGTETFRKAPTAYADISNKAYITVLFELAEAVGTHKEFGTFIDGSATPNSGQLFSHVAVDWTKASDQTLTIDIIYTIN